MQIRNTNVLFSFSRRLAECLATINNLAVTTRESKQNVRQDLFLNGIFISVQQIELMVGVIEK